ncbi:MAG: hypothetical protein ACI86X_000824 [Moritella sp.]
MEASMRTIKLHLPTLKIIWKLLVVLLFPLVIWLYSIILDIPFREIDAGANYHKWIIFVIYLGCLASWLSIDRGLSRRYLFRN